MAENRQMTEEEMKEIKERHPEAGKHAVHFDIRDGERIVDLASCFPTVWEGVPIIMKLISVRVEDLDKVGFPPAGKISFPA